MTLWNCWIVVRLFLIPMIGGISYKRRQWLMWGYGDTRLPSLRTRGPKCHTSRSEMSHKQGQNVTQSCYNIYSSRCNSTEDWAPAGGICRYLIFRWVILIWQGCEWHKKGNRNNGCLGDMHPLIARFMGPTWSPSGADRTQVGPMFTTWTLLSGPFQADMQVRG